ncbi:hypothetical protein OVA11_14280 [Caulobacter sp. SL161]|uniref:hypothetical protein n=1 Tax=Caulobacter sp. SL161 TaxID=2995156 RepID=UPI0022730F17|nr:hypothetical protein [Caulobacter sp. SL161]MCY1648188.1 hypothetical protein [Caulobacter sp. SL161]
MDELGQLIDVNIALDATLTGGDCLPTLPLSNLQIPAGEYLKSPARFVDATDLDGTQFEAELPWAQSINLIALLFTTLSRTALFRLTIAGADGDLDNPIYQGEWTPVVPRLWQSSSLDWGAPNWWTGQPLARDLDLYPRHRWMPLPARTLCKRLRVELDDRDNPDGWIDIGGLLIGLGWSPWRNFDRGRQRELIVRSLIEETPSGRLITEARRPRRQQRVTWSMLTAADADRITDASIRASDTGVVFFVPDLGDPASLLRDCFPATIALHPQPTLGFPGLHTATATFREVIA